MTHFVHLRAAPGQPRMGVLTLLAQLLILGHLGLLVLNRKTRRVGGIWRGKGASSEAVVVLV